jgi:membrane protein
MARLTPRAAARLARRAIADWFADGAPRHGAAIAYYTLFALAPMLLVVIAIAGLVFGEEAVRGEIMGQVAGLIGSDGARAVQAILQRASEPREGIGATLLGLAGLLFATTGAFLELQAALNKAWKVQPEPGPAIDVGALVVRRLRSFGMVVSIGFLLMVSLAVGAAVNALAAWFETLAPALPAVLMVANATMGIAVSTALFAMLFRILPDVQLAWRDVLAGALVTALLFAVGQRLIGLYLGQSAVGSPFGAAGALAVVLVWVYYSAQIVLLGAEFTHHYAKHRAGEPPPLPGARRA